jgi:hypothetical protein
LRQNKFENGDKKKGEHVKEKGRKGKKRKFEVKRYK